MSRLVCVLLLLPLTSCGGHVADNCTEGEVVCEDYWCREGAEVAAMCCDDEGGYIPMGRTADGFKFRCVIP